MVERFEEQFEVPAAATWDAEDGMDFTGKISPARDHLAAPIIPRGIIEGASIPLPLVDYPALEKSSDNPSTPTEE
jgi:hypothetical protein